MIEIGLIVEGRAKKKAPVDTGNLCNSITYEPRIDEKAVYVGTLVKYAPYVEYGHRVGASSSFVPPKPFLYPAIEESRDNIRRIVEDYLKNA